MKNLGILLLVAGCLTFTARAAETENDLDFNLYGAIAYSPSTGLYGYSTDQWNRASAESAAVFMCRAWDCRAIVWVMNGCAAVSVAGNGGNGWAIAYNRWAAQSNAQSECLIRNGGICTPLSWVCTAGW